MGTATNKAKITNLSSPQNGKIALHAPATLKTLKILFYQKLIEIQFFLESNLLTVNLLSQ